MKKYYVVSEEILPAALVKTAKVKEMLLNGIADNVNTAADSVGIARSTYYKYKDGISTFFDLKSMDIVNVSMILIHNPGILSDILNSIASFSGNVITINQSLPANNSARVTLSIAMNEATVTPKEMLDRLIACKGVVEVNLDGIN